MSLDKKLFKAVATTTTTDADAPQGLVLHLDANDEDSIEQDSQWWKYKWHMVDISTHNLNIPFDKASNLQLHLNASDATSRGGSGTTWTDIWKWQRCNNWWWFWIYYEKTQGYFHLMAQMLMRQLSITMLYWTSHHLVLQLRLS